MSTWDFSLCAEGSRRWSAATFLRSGPGRIIDCGLTASGARMSSATWEQRIARAEKLAAAHPATAEMLGFYATIARFQKEIYDSLNGDKSSQTSRLAPYFVRLLDLV